MTESALLAHFSALTDEEQEILAGKPLDMSRYQSAATNAMVEGQKFLRQDRLITIRPHTRFTAFPPHRHDYVEMMYMEAIGTFSSSDARLNRLWQNILWGMKSNFVDIPTDCPQRDERMGWTGDAQIFSATASFLMNTYPFFEKWLTDLACDQTSEGGVPHVVPDTITGETRAQDNWLVREGTHSAAAWADAAVIIPWNLYLAYGDTAILQKQYASMWARATASNCP